MKGLFRHFEFRDKDRKISHPGQRTVWRLGSDHFRQQIDAMTEC
jgi:hypothetical protein